MKFTIAAILSAALSAVCAQTAAAPATAGVAVNLPGHGSVIQAGQPFTITWTVTDPAVTAIDSIALLAGSSSNLETRNPNILSAAIATTPSQYVWNVPANVETGPSYVLAFKNPAGQTTYSTYFTIVGAAPGTNGAVTSASIAVTSGAPAASGSTIPAGNTVGGAVASASISVTGGNNHTSGAARLTVGVMSVAGVAIALLI
ncbi:hypothetical protein BY458DRAFT_520328 [Sporodiniella umbellata]|nr:hypothetical protein BY458DRAFT_520328 [Sporodiniella umbellata]